jgi:secreted Zn-dependent insulinase-like peptidase
MITREAEAVDSEYEMSLHDDGHRREEVLMRSARKGHPMGRFMWGMFWFWAYAKGF